LKFFLLARVTHYDLHAGISETLGGSGVFYLRLASHLANREVERQSTSIG